MNLMAITKMCLCLSLLALIPVSSNAASCVWSVTRDGKTAYIGGTCHCLSKSDYPLPAEYEFAYRNSETLVFECDLDAIKSLDAAKQIETAYSFPKGTTLKTCLSAPLYARLSAVCASNSIPLVALERYKPPMVMLALTFSELKKIGIDPAWGVDSQMHRRAKADGKKENALETFSQQIGYLASISDGQEEEFVKYSLTELDSTGENFKEIVKAWRSGDTVQLHRLVTETLCNQFESIYRKLILERNRNWLPELEKLLATPEREFVLVGAAHLLGPDSVLESLRKRGYEVKPLEVGEKKD